jgi:hypothetical protein
MDTFNALSQLGVSHLGLIDAGKILGILKVTEEIKISAQETIDSYSWEISVEIAEMLIARIPEQPYPKLKEHLTKKLAHWVSNSLSWTQNEVVFNQDVLIQIPKSDFDTLELEQEELINYLNTLWVHKESTECQIATLSSAPDSELDIRFFFNLIY